MSPTVCVIMYAGFPVLLRSKLQTESDLSTAQAEYMPLVHMIHDVIPL